MIAHFSRCWNCIGEISVNFELELEDSQKPWSYLSITSLLKWALRHCSLGKIHWIGISWADPCRPLPDYVVSIKGGPKLWNHVSKVWRLLVWRNKTDEKLDVKISFFGCNFAKHELAKLLTIYMTTRDHPRSKPHGPGPAGVGGPWNLKNHSISPRLGCPRD